MARVVLPCFQCSGFQTKRSEVVRVALTAQKILRSRILKALLEHRDGKASRKEVLRDLERGYGALWTPEDRMPPKSRPFEANWMNRASYERASMVRDGLLADGGGGLWILTPEGRRAAEKTT